MTEPTLANPESIFRMPQRTAVNIIATLIEEGYINPVLSEAAKENAAIAIDPIITEAFSRVAYSAVKSAILDVYDQAVNRMRGR